MKIRTAAQAAVLATALTAIPVLAASAQTKPAADPRVDLVFAEIDADRDGKVTRSEFNAFRTALFTGADANKDGFLDSVEVAALMRSRSIKRAGDRLAAFDRNKDGKLTLDEIPGPRKLRFWFVDANLDGAVTKEEAEKAATARLRRQIVRAFRRLDVDRNGTLSKNEFVDGDNRFFRRFDVNNDKSVNREEVAAVLARFNQARASHRHRRFGPRRHRVEGRRFRRDRMGPRWRDGRRHERRRGENRGERRGSPRQ